MGKIHKVVKAKWPHVTSVRPLAVRTAGEIRTRDLFHSHWNALSAELQRYARWNLDLFQRMKRTSCNSCGYLYCYSMGP